MTDATNLPVTKNPGEALCLHYRQDFERALGYELISGHLAFEPFMMAVKADVMREPKLREAFAACPQSAIDALMLAAQCKLLPGGAYGLFYLIPRNMNRKTANGWQKRMEVTPLIGYKGLATMAARHPRVHSVEAACIYEGEEFSLERGSGRLHHPWDPRLDRPDSAIIGAYAKVVITEAQTNHVVDTPIVWPLTLADIHRSRSRSEAWKYAEQNGKKDSPWHTDFAAMARKSAIRAILQNGSVPRDMGIGGVLHAEEAVDTTAGDARLEPGPTRQGEIRQALGIEEAPQPAGFDPQKDADLAGGA